MKFANNLDCGSQIIQAKFPEFRDCHLVGDDSGWDNYAIRVDNKFLFRFPRQKEALAQIKKETEVLSLLEPKLPPHIKVPKYLATSLASDYPFVYYEMIQGQPLTKDLYDKLTDEKKAKLVQQIVDFLHILHNIGINQCKNLEKVNALNKYQHLYQQVSKICFKYLTKEEQAKTKALFENYLQDPVMRAYIPTVVHNDLSENHIIITETGIGVIDFGDTDIFDPAIDLSWFYLFDQKLFRDIIKKYHSGKNTNFEKRIAEFYMPIIPYYGIIYGEETHNPELIKNELNDLRQNLAQ